LRRMVGFDNASRRAMRTGLWPGSRLVAPVRSGLGGDSSLGLRVGRGLALGFALLSACTSEAPAPTPLDDPKENRLGQAQMPPRPENPTLKNADLDQPGPRSDAQLGDEALERVLAEAETKL